MEEHDSYITPKDTYSQDYVAETDENDIPLSLVQVDKALESCSGNNCSGYRGKQNKSNTGKKCKAWNSVDGHTGTYFKKDNLEGNFCRNPDPSNSKTIWCYIEGGTPNHYYEYCNPIGVSAE